MGIKGLKISMIVSISFDTEAMPRLNPQQREQAIGRLHAGQPTRVIANDLNCNVRTIERLRVRYNATNSTNGRPRCGRPQVTIDAFMIIYGFVQKCIGLTHVTCC
jgi:hypothetical protein